MGLTAESTGLGMMQENENLHGDYRIALAGNPNVGKSTVFNALTGLHQHTGNWAGKTVTNAAGIAEYGGKRYVLVDLPGTYSLRANSAEEEAARDYLCQEQPDAVIVVCDACCLERNLNLVLQVMELSEKVLVCVNLLDEAEKRGISVDFEHLENLLGVPVIGVTARSEEGLDNMLERLQNLLDAEQTPHFQPDYGEQLEPQLRILTDLLQDCTGTIPPRWAALRFLEGEPCVTQLISPEGIPPCFPEHLGEIQRQLKECGMTEQRIQDHLIEQLVHEAEHIAGKSVSRETTEADVRDRKLDRILTSRKFGIPLMLLLLALILWLTMAGANYPSALLSEFLFSIGDAASRRLSEWGAPAWVDGLFIQGMYRTLAWVVSVMLPPMAIFFPLFTLLEDAGYLPRAAFNLDHRFRKCGACGKQALTMCMGFGCNAAGVTGCRIIDSPRERLIAILTNSLVPCNGRFPMLISLITMFFVTGIAILDSLLSTLILLLLILCGVGMTFLLSTILSRTLLKGMPSSFTLELPPYRKPQIGRVLVRSVLDRTIFVLGRACIVAAPTGMLIWLLANCNVENQTLLHHLSTFLDPFAQYFGMDGTILLGFLLGFPANEIVIPIIIMTYLSEGSLTEITELSTLHSLFVENGWTLTTAICTMLFSLFHFPCSTTVLTVYKETKSLKWALFSMLLPTAAGLCLCFAVNLIAGIV
ncbi:MAG: ferrous iron transport protein B [Oscillospiraceae bacterium]|nr:ferrous iron transport protein B [Oscillospiraceae bacterium]